MGRSESFGYRVACLHRYAQRYYNRELEHLGLGNGTYSFLMALYNENGINQAVVSGAVEHTKKIISFIEDLSAFYVANISKAALDNVNFDVAETDGREYDVVEVNRGGFSNFNIVIDAPNVGDNPAAQGRVAREVRTIFDQRPRIEVNTEVGARFLQTDTNATFALGGVDADTVLTMDILEVPEGLPATMMIALS